MVMKGAGRILNGNFGQGSKKESISNQYICCWYKSETLFIGKWPTFTSYGYAGLGLYLSLMFMSKILFFAELVQHPGGQKSESVESWKCGRWRVLAALLVQVLHGPGRSSDDDRCAAAWCAAASCPR